MKKAFLLGCSFLILIVSAGMVSAAITTFDYTQTDSTSRPRNHSGPGTEHRRRGDNHLVTNRNAAGLSA